MANRIAHTSRQLTERVIDDWAESTTQTSKDQAFVRFEAKCICFAFTAAVLSSVLDDGILDGVVGCKVTCLVTALS